MILYNSKFNSGALLDHFFVRFGKFFIQFWGMFGRCFNVFFIGFFKVGAHGNLTISNPIVPGFKDLSVFITGTSDFSLSIGFQHFLDLVRDVIVIKLMLMYNIQPLPSTQGPTPVFLNDRYILCSVILF